MPEDYSMLREVAWRDLCPWLIILKTFRLAAGCRVLALTAAAMIAISAGWRLIGAGFSGFADDSPQLRNWIDADSAWPWTRHVSNLPAVPVRAAGLLVIGPGTVRGPLTDVWRNLTEPFGRLLQDDLSTAGLFYVLGACGWSLVVWALFGGAITRICALSLTQDERLGLIGAVQFASPKWPAYLAGPLLPVIGSLVVVIPLWIVGWITRWDFLLSVAGVLWALTLLAGLLLAILMLGLAAGWPLMWAAVSVEDSDSWDAVSRAYSYVFERPLHLLFYVVVGSLFGVVAIAVFDLFADFAYRLSLLPFLWGWGGDAADLGAPIGGFWVGVIEMIKGAFRIGFFWANATAIYLLLRRSTDATEIDEVALSNGAATREMPPLKTDAHGVPAAAPDEPAGP